MIRTRSYPNNIVSNYSSLVFSFAPKKILVSTLIIVAFVNVLLIYYATTLPALEGRWLVTNKTVVFEKAGGNYQITTISVDLNNGQKITSKDLIEEPDLLNYYAEYNDFFVKQSLLYNLLLQNKVSLETIDGDILLVNTTSRNWYQLPFLFWLQVLVATIAVIIGAWLWSFRQNDIAAQQYFLSGVFLGCVIFPAAIYSTRPLAIPGDVFHFFSLIDHFGLYMYCAAMMTLNWQFPDPINKFKFPQTCYLMMFIIWCMNTLQLFPDLNTSVRIIPILVLILTAYIVSLQWRKCRQYPHKLILVKWFLLTTVIGAGLFISIIFIPPLLGYQIIISQGAAFAAFLIVYLSMAIAVSRYKLFNFDRWCSESLLWLLSGLLVITLDLLIIAVLNISYLQATWIALALTGWVYFPLRQILLKRLFLHQPQELSTHLPFVVAEIATCTNEHQFWLSLEKCFTKIFSPMHIDYVPANNKQIYLANDGSTLTARTVDQKNSIEMTFADHGKRIFNSNDMSTALALIELFEHAMHASKEKKEGIKIERNRIRQDIHDSLGGYILAIMHRKVDPKSAHLARLAWNELRDVLSALSLKPARLSLELQRWHKSLQYIISDEKLIFDYDINDYILNNPIYISSIKRLNLGQIIRESVINAYRHTNPSIIKASFNYEDQQLVLRIENNGVVSDPKAWIKGRGLINISNRVAQLNGDVNWKLIENKLIVLTIIIPLISEHEESVFE